MTRPKGKPKQYAANNLIAPSTPWNGLPAALEPSDGVAAAGLFQPDQSLPSRYANHQTRDVGLRLLDLDAIEIRNWPTPGNGAGSIASGGNTSKHAGAKLWHPERPIIFIDNENDLMISYDDGTTWAAEYSPASGEHKRLAQSATSNLVAFEVTGSGFIAAVGSSDATWSSQALTGCTAIQDMVYDRWEDVYYVGGTHSGSAAIWRLVNAAGVLPMSETFVDTGETPGYFRQVAVSEAWKLAIGDSEFWRWPPATTPVPVKQTSPLTGPMGGASNWELQYIEPDGQFILMAADGSTVYVLTSPDAQTWTDRSSLIPADFELGGAPNRSAVRGSIFAVPGTMGTSGATGILWTGDAGLTWEWVPDPLARHTSLTPDPTLDFLAVGDRRWMGFGYVAAGSHAHCQGFRMGA